MSDSIWFPYIEVETNAGIREVSLATRHLMNRRIFLTGTVNSEAANQVVSQLLYLSETDKKPIHLYINSTGGEINAALLVYDAIQGLEVPLNTYCMGRAFDMAALILAGAQKGRRWIFPHSQIMIHKPAMGGGVGGFAGSVSNQAERILQTKELLSGIWAKHTGRTPEEIEAATSYEHFMNAEESVAFGICDGICSALI